MQLKPCVNTVTRMKIQIILNVGFIKDAKIASILINVNVIENVIFADPLLIAKNLLVIILFVMNVILMKTIDAKFVRTQIEN